MKRVATLSLVTVLTVLVVTLGACGKKEPPKQPEGATYPRPYPPR